jgi:hypothetical protein
MNWNGKPTYCPQCGNKTLVASGIENMINSQVVNADHYKCSNCKNEMDIIYNPKEFIEIKKEKK